MKKLKCLRQYWDCKLNPKCLILFCEWAEWSRPELYTISINLAKFFFLFRGEESPGFTGQDAR